MSAALIVATPHGGCAAWTHPETQVCVLSSDRLNLGPVGMGEPQEPGSAQQHATQGLLGSLTPCVHQSSGCPDLVRPRALAACRDRRAPHGLRYPGRRGPFGPASHPVGPPVCKSPRGRRTEQPPTRGPAGRAWSSAGLRLSRGWRAGHSRSSGRPRLTTGGSPLNSTGWVFRRRVGVGGDQSAGKVWKQVGGPTGPGPVPRVGDAQDGHRPVRRHERSCRDDETADRERASTQRPSQQRVGQGVGNADRGAGGESEQCRRTLHSMSS